MTAQTLTTAAQIRAGLKGEGRVYIRQFPGSADIRVFDSRMREGRLQVKTQDGWYTVLRGDEVWGV